MAIFDHYAPCSCGSGKKFKWCCEPIYREIDHAFEQERQGQHEAALRMMAELTARHAENPEAWGRYAQLFAANNKLEEAEQALDKAFAINANYPYGLLLRAQFRFAEGEIAGALLLGRKAAAAYDPEAKSFIADAYSLIFQCEMRLRRPIAARAALRIVMHCDPSDEGLRDAFEKEYGAESRLPEAVRRDYAFLAPNPAHSGGDRRSAWDRAMSGTAVPRLDELASLFDRLTKEDAEDAAAWFNLGLARAWIGDNRQALDALNRYLELETDEARATSAATLMEVLRFGQGVEDECDYLEYSFAVQARDPQALGNFITELQNARRLVIPSTQQEGAFVALVLEFSQQGLITAGSAPAEVGRLAGYLAVIGSVVRVWGIDRDAVLRIREEMRPHLKFALGEAQEQRHTAQFVDVSSEALVLPVADSSEASARLVLEHAETYYEGKWIHKPRRSLLGNTPVDAAQFPVLRRKLRGVIQLMQDCARRSALGGYDFDRLRRQLGLLETAPGAAPSGPAGIEAMNAADLAALKVEEFSDQDLELALHTAQKLDAPHAAVRLGKALVGRPVKAEKVDRFPTFSYLIQRAIKDGDLAAALDQVNEGERQDCEHNAGLRRNDYELRRAQVLAKRGESAEAENVFQRLIQRSPDELKYRAAAAEAMLNLKQGAKALRFAEEGLTEARKRNDRDSEGHLMELAGAARKQMG